MILKPGFLIRKEKSKTSNLPFNPLELKQKVLQQYQTSKEWREELGHALKNYLKNSGHSVVEWGSGHSSAIFSEIASEIVSVEHNSEYLDEVKKSLKPGTNVEFLVSPIDEFKIENFEQEHFETLYSTAPFSLNRSFDVTFVDGRVRNECLLASAYIGHKESLHLLHDFRRARYCIGRFFFDTLEDGYKGLVVLKRKPELEKFFSGFQNYFNDQNSNSSSTKLNDPNISKEHLTHLITETANNYHGEKLDILEWGNPQSTECFIDFLKQSPETQAEIVSIRSNLAHVKYWGHQDKKFLKEIPVQESGAKNPGGRDANYHYATAPIFLRKKYDLIYVGWVRRNECLMTAAAFLKESGRVILRQGAHKHYALGRYLYEVESEFEGFQVLKVKKEIKDLLQDFIQIQNERFPCASIDVLT